MLNTRHREITGVKCRCRCSESEKQGLFLFRSGPLHHSDHPKESFSKPLFKHARVLTVTKSEDRINGMIEANIRVDKQGKDWAVLLPKRDNFDLRSPHRALEGIWIGGKKGGRRQSAWLIK